MRAKTKNTILAMIVMIVAIFVPSFIFGKWLEGVTFFICHSLIRPQYPKEYHHILHSMCRIITGSVFFFGVSFVLPLAWSLFSAVPINYLIGWVGFTKKQADEYEVKYTKLKAQLEKKKEFNVDTCTEAELIERCRELRFSAENTELCIDLFIRKIKQSDIADKLCIEEKSIQQRKRRFKQKLNKK
jgi:hypothetical protein